MSSSVEIGKTLGAAERHRMAVDIVNELPQGGYTEHYQPDFGDSDLLTDCVQELLSTKPVTTPENIRELSTSFAATVSGAVKTAVVIDHNCAEPVHLGTPLEAIAHEIADNLEATVVDDDGNEIDLLRIKRGRGQNTKPRSNEFEKVTIPGAPGEKDQEILLPSYMGDAVNFANDYTRRTPDPRLMVGAADQARDLEALLYTLTGRHVPAAHEALLLAYEKSFLQTDPQTKKQYLLSADLPWIGVRTNNPAGAHVQLLKHVENPIGIKLDAKTTPEHLSQLVTELNPGRKIGKLVLMPRFGVANLSLLPQFAEAVAQITPEALIVGDPMHGNTLTLANGRKTRYVGDIIEEAEAVSKALREVGLKQHGVHLETIGDDSRKQCIDNHAEKPDQSLVDPQLNRTQNLRVLRAIGPSLL